MPKLIWIGTVELEFTREETPRRAERAFTNITTWAEDYGEFCKKSQQMLEHYGWKLLGVEQARAIGENEEFGDVVEDMIDRTRTNPSAIIYGTFHTYPYTVQ